MNFSQKQYNDPKSQNNIENTFVRHGWIPTVVHVQYRESRSREWEQQPMQRRYRGGYVMRRQGWVAWPKI